ncbi:hypothetical protein LWI29_029977 [Acer saccharum]|uniref:Uncharacterized protein n=1 Tax=Acer saccharum TaxID=4024 RepID=A0AA39THG4_ACESA|nr:hypothetical protein LWI29_029977 [Acer saccharum]
METLYESLQDIISRLVNVNPNEFSIKMKCIYNSPEVLAPFEVVNDDDVQVFLCENSVVNKRISLCVTTEWKTRIIPNTQSLDNELVNEDIANVCESENDNGVGLDNIRESLLSPNDFQNADVFSIRVDNEYKAGDRNVPFALSSVPATNAAAPTRRTRLRFMSSRRRGGHDAARQSPLRSPIQEAVPDHLERRFADVISAVEALQEEV